VRLLGNPILLRAAIVLFFAGFAFLLGLVAVRALRKSITEDNEISKGSNASLETLPLHLYNTVIQQLKQQKHELQVQSQAEQQRARTSETFSQAVLSNLSSGVLVFGANGLVKTANGAAKTILGFASTTGMSAEDIFRDALVHGSSDSFHVSDEIHSVLREDSKRREAEAEYRTPAGEKRSLAMTISQVPAGDGSLLGVTCLISDRSELESIRQNQELQGEISAEMALQLRGSLRTIAGYAQHLASNHDPDMAQQLANDIAQEAAQLDRTIGGFLTAKPELKRAGAAGSAK
jgi:PAS domain-containing protein